MKDSKSTVKNTVILVIIAVILSAILGITNQVTKDKIIEQNLKVKQDAYAAVMPEAASFEEDAELTAAVEMAPALLETLGNKSTIVEALTAKDEAGSTLGVVINIDNPEGYGGVINLSIGVDAEGTLTGMKVVSNSETAGLGAHCTDESFRDQFTGIKSAQIEYSKTGKSADNEIDAISSATFTTKSVTNGVNAGLAFAYAYLGLN